MEVREFYYFLPEELIAQEPIENRDESRLLVLKRYSGEICHRTFKDIVDYLNPGDCLVLNDTKVIPARLYGVKEDSGGKMEFVLLKNLGQDIWEVLVRPGRRARRGARFVFGNGELKAKIIDKTESGTRLVEFEYNGNFRELLNEIGIIPLPPYIKRELKNKNRYQTVYAKNEGSVAAPTAGLHFTEELLYKLQDKGINIGYVTLHVGLDTFRPVKVKNIEEHKMHSEYFEVSEDTCGLINHTKEIGKRVIAVGTTSCRVIETIANNDGKVNPGKGWTELFIYPGYKFKVMDGLVTNFHLPESTLLMLVSAFAGKDNIMKAYREAIEKKYRFFSFGDAMLII